MGASHLRLVTGVVAAVCTLGAACGEPARAPARGGPDALKGGSEGTYAIPQFNKRPYTLHLPISYAPQSAVPVVVVLHGGGGNAENAKKMTCPDGNAWSSGCMAGLGEAEGFAVVYPSGTGSVVWENARTWNAGGGADGFQCVSGEACENAVDDVAYFDAVYDEVVRAVNVDPARVFVTGLSNGAAMAHRLACERATRIAAVAALSGGNQFAATASCVPARPVSVMEMHGTADPCWEIGGGTSACAQDDGMTKVSIDDSVAGWVERNGCPTESVDDALDDTADDGTTSTRSVFFPCVDGAEVVFVRSQGGGHAWPQGWAYLPEGEIGPVVQDFNANELMWRFFQRHPLPAAPTE